MSLLQENFLRSFFWVLKPPWHFSKFTKLGPRMSYAPHVQIRKENPKGNVLNTRRQIPNRYGTLKPSEGEKKPWNCYELTFFKMDKKEITVHVFRNHNSTRLLPPATKLRQGNVFTPILSFCSGRAPGQTPPPSRHTHPLPPGRHPPPGADTIPPAQCMLGYGQQAGGTHLTGMQSCYKFKLLKHRKD